MMICIDKERCIGCGQCAKDCIVHSIQVVDGKAEMIQKRCLQCGHCVAVCPVEAVTIPGMPESEVLPVTGMKTATADTLLNLIKTRRSVRFYQDKAVEPEKITAIMEAGRFTPTGANVQTTRYVVVTERLNAFKDIVVDGLALLGHEVVQMILGSDFHKERSQTSCTSLTFNAPHVLIVICGGPVCTPMNGVLAAQSMELMMHALGLGACYNGFTERVLNSSSVAKEFLQLQDGEQVSACLYFGYPDMKYYRTVSRKPAVVTWM